MGSASRKLLGFSAFAVVSAALLGASSPAQATTVPHGLEGDRQGPPERRSSAGRLDAATAAEYRADTTHALAVIDRIPPDARVSCSTSSTRWRCRRKRYDAPRALALFSMLAENASYFATHPLPTTRIDVADEDGVVYRWFPGEGLQFHPLASFGALNAAAAANDDGAGRRRSPRPWSRAASRRRSGRCASSTGSPSRAASRRGSRGWRRPSRRRRSRAPATSSTRRYLDPARASYGLVSHWLVQQLPSGPWIKLYAFNRDVVLNAQLQTILSLDDYAEISRRPGRAGARGQPPGDRGGAPAPLRQRLLVVLLARQGRVDARLPHLRDPAPAEARAAHRRHDLDGHGARASPTTCEPARADPGEGDAADPLPVPADGFRDTLAVKLWLSKISRVTLSLGGASRTVTLGARPARIR